MKKFFSDVSLLILVYAYMHSYRIFFIQFKKDELCYARDIQFYMTTLLVDLIKLKLNFWMNDRKKRFHEK